MRETINAAIAYILFSGVAYFNYEFLKPMFTVVKCIYCKLQFLQSALKEIVKLKDKGNVPLF